MRGMDMPKFDTERVREQLRPTMEALGRLTAEILKIAPSPTEPGDETGTEGMSEREWQQMAQDLGGLVASFLEEFDDMCRGSEHQSKAQDALARLADLAGVDGANPATKPAPKG